MEKIWLYAKDSYEAKYQFLINKSESMGYIIFLMILKLLLNTQVTDDVCKNIEEYNRNKKCKILTVFDDVTPGVLSNKKLKPIVTKLFIRGRKQNISLVFITQSYFAVLKNIRLNSMHYFIMKNQNKRELQQIAFYHSSDINFKNFKNLYEKCTAKPY